MEDAVGLVHPPVHREAHDDPLGTGLEDLDVEELVDAVAAVGQRGRAVGTRPSPVARAELRSGMAGGVVTAGC